MNLECAQCQARYRIDDAVIPPQGARVRCRHCSNVIDIPAPVIELAPSDLELIPPPQPAHDIPGEAPSTMVEIPVGEPAGIPSRSEPTRSEPARPEPARPAILDESAPAPALAASPVAPSAPAGAAAPAAAAPVASPAPAASPAPSPGDSFEHFGQPPSAPPPVSQEFERFAPVSSGAVASPPSPQLAEAPAAPALAPVLPSAEPATPALSEAVASAPQAEAESPQGASGGAPTGALAAAMTAGTPIPEGLSPEERTKHEKARRLARVLASDIAIYNREKRERGIRDGNLVAVLGYEIKKSWEVYKERVGADFANSTPYFRDALNDMLAEGKKIF